MQLKLMSSVCAVALALAFAPAAWAGYDEPGIDDGNAIASDGSTATIKEGMGGPGGQRPEGQRTGGQPPAAPPTTDSNTGATKK